MIPCTWLATYPKSGTTWTRFLVHELLAGPPETSAALEQVIPTIHGAEEGWRSHLDRGGILATHKEYGPQTDRYGPPSGFVHVVRHPVDVLLSEARFFCLMQAGDVARKEGRVDHSRLDELLLDYLKVMIHGGTTERHRRLGMGSWASNLGSWLAARERHPHALLRYEDLVRDPVGELARLATFLGVDTTDLDLQAIVERCAAPAMRRMQEREIARRQPGRFYEGDDFEVAYDLGCRFVGPATVGEGRKLGEAACARIEQLFGDAMARVGYRFDAGAPVVDPLTDDLRAIDPLPEGVATALTCRA